MVLGFLAVRIGLFGEVGTKRLVLFVFNAAIPTMLFYRIGAIDFPEQIEWSFLLAYYGSTFAIYAAGMLVGRFTFGHGLAEQTIFGLGAGFSNTVLLGIPLMASAFGDEATLPVFLIIAFHSASILPVSVALLEAGRSDEGTRAGSRLTALVVQVLANPIILGILFGLGSKLRRPHPSLDRSNWWRKRCPPSQFPPPSPRLGASLARYRLSGQIGSAVTLSTLKLIVHPLLAWVIAVPVLGLGAPWAPVARRHGRHADRGNGLPVRCAIRHCARRRGQHGGRVVCCVDGDRLDPTRPDGGVTLQSRRSVTRPSPARFERADPGRPR